MSNYTEAGILKGLQDAATTLEEVLEIKDGLLSIEQNTMVLLALTRGVLLSLDKCASCPALYAYSAFKKWLFPILFGLALAAFVGGLYAFQYFGLKMP